MPKNVAMSHAHAVRGCCAELVELVVIALSSWWRGVDFFEQLGIEHGRADSISAACPFSQIDQSASIAAKRELHVRAQHNGLAGRAAQAECFLTWHISNQRSYHTMRATRS